MQQTKPLFIIKKYRSILHAAIIIDAVSYIVSLTDSIVAGNCLNSDALAAIGLISPFLFFSTFFSSIINSGTILNYSYETGRFKKMRALEFFSQGIWLALLTGLVYSGVLFLMREPIIACITEPGPIREYAHEYYPIILLFFFFSPLSCLLDNMLIADGGEKLSAAANILQILANIVLSLIFVNFWGIRGIAFASVISKLLFILIVCLHFLSRRNTLQLLRHWKWQDCLLIVRSGIVKASSFALDAVLTFFINLFALHYFSGNDTLILLTLVEKYLGLQSVFIGMSMSAQPLIGTLRGESNTKALAGLMKQVCKDMICAGFILTVLTMAFAPFITRCFGINKEPLLSEGATALRIIGATMIPQALSALFFIYFYSIEKNSVSFSITLLKNLLYSLALSVLFSIFVKNRNGIWTGLALAPVMALITVAVFIYPRYDRKEFPFLISSDRDDTIFIFDFVNSPDAAGEMSNTANHLLKDYPFSQHVKNLISLYLEEILLLINEKNHDLPRINVECTIMVEFAGIRVILRDSGKFFDITDSDAIPDSFNQYMVSNLMVVQENKAYMLTTGYNRIEMFFTDN